MESSFLIVAVLLLIVSFANAAKVCPGYAYGLQQQNCTSTCSASKDLCPVGKKCCLLIKPSCGFHCVTPKDNVEKAGKCPTSASTTDNPSWGVCDAHFCDVDNDCDDTDKCCPNMCESKICIAPQ